MDRLEDFFGKQGCRVKAAQSIIYGNLAPQVIKSKLERFLNLETGVSYSVRGAFISLFGVLKYKGYFDNQIPKYLREIKFSFAGIAAAIALDYLANEYI